MNIEHIYLLPIYVSVVHHYATFLPFKSREIRLLATTLAIPLKFIREIETLSLLIAAVFVFVFNVYVRTSV